MSDQQTKNKQCIWLRNALVPNTICDNKKSHMVNHAVKHSCDLCSHYETGENRIDKYLRESKESVNKTIKVVEFLMKLDFFFF